MKQRIPFAVPCRLFMSCSAALMLAACGGGTDPLGSQRSLAATVVSDVPAASAPAGAGAVVDAAPVSEHVAAVPSVPVDAAAPAPTPRKDAPASNQFQLNGYQTGDTAAQSGAGADGAPAAPPADGQHPTQRPAA